MNTRTMLALLPALALFPRPSLAESEPALIAASPSHAEVVHSVAGMVQDQRAQALARERGLNIVNVLWEDTGRSVGSSVGPNISDVTIEVQVESPGQPARNELMPVLRYPNFTDKTADVRLDKLYLRVGNHDKGGKLETVSLKKLLANPMRYMSFPAKGRIKGGSLLARRDSHALVSAQHAFLPVPHGGKATFYPVIFNYQSYADNPAVLTIVVTRQGSSMAIVDNGRDTVGGGGSWGQRLYFNDGGQRAPLMAERLADVQSAGTTANGESAASLGQDANLLMIIQVPLRVRPPAPPPPRRRHGLRRSTRSRSGAGAPAAAGRASDVDQAVLGHGPSEGPYTELAGLTIARDPRFPVRVTVQFYQATSNGIIDQENVAHMAAQIDKIYASADYVGSLVVPGKDDARRPTMWHDDSPTIAH